MNSLRTYAQLVRLPNLPSALADVCMAAMAVGMSRSQWPAFLLLLLSSSCSYMGGMVWNDFFDVEQDARERPNRPIPSGRITRRRAGSIGAGLLAAGLLFALLAGWVMAIGGLTMSLLRTGLISAFLTAAILLYDGLLKRTWFGPVVMGSCRFLNVLLGVSLAGSLKWPLGPHLALVVGWYIVGVTWFARTEATTSNKINLAGAAAIMLSALLLALPVPVHFETPAASPLFPYLLVALGFVVGLPVSKAIATPTPERVQSAVKRSLMGLILLDTVLATATVGTIGLVLLVLLAPSIYLNRRRWLYST
jgi:4-hydroxybenzoate polyprenyltransferase